VLIEFRILRASDGLEANFELTRDREGKREREEAADEGNARESLKFHEMYVRFRVSFGRNGLEEISSCDTPLGIEVSRGIGHANRLICSRSGNAPGNEN